jgi:hypothetical protein
MTIAEIQRRQLAPGVPANQQLHAVGKYQIIGATMRSLMQGRYGATGVTPSDRYTPEVQERLGLALARNRVQGRSTNQAMSGLRQEWIGLQNVRDADLRQAVIELQGSGQLAVSPRPASGPAFAMTRQEQGAGFGVAEAQAEQQAATATTVSELLTKLIAARTELEKAFAEATGAVLPVEQLKLDNQYLAERNRLVLAGKPEEVVAMEEARGKAMDKSASIRAALNTAIAKTTSEIREEEKALAASTSGQEIHLKFIEERRKQLAILEGKLKSLTQLERDHTRELAVSTLEQLKNADAMKAVEEAVAMVEGAVSGAISSYKGFVSEVLQGGDIREAAQKLQSALSEQVITMFLDFSMKPMQQFFEKELKRMFNLPDEEALRAQEIQRLEALIAALDRNTAAITSPPSPASAAPAAQGAPLGDQSFNTAPWTPLMAGGSAQVAQVMRGSGQSSPLPTTFPNHGFPAGTFTVFEDALRRKREAEALQQMAPAAPMPPVPSIVPSSTIAPTAEALAPVTEAIKATGDAAATAQPQLAAGAQQFKWTMGTTVQAFGMAVGAITSIVAGISQMKKGGVSGVLGGLGSIFMGVGGAIGGFSNMFKPAVPAVAPAAAATGFKLFANGGVVHGPTLGMIGEGRYSEAVVPLPDGRTIPVQMRNSASRDLLNERSSGAAVSPILSMSFQSTRFGGKDYVDVEQLEQAMAETERRAVRGGATRGASLALDRLQHSPTTRKKVGLR